MVKTRQNVLLDRSIFSDSVFADRGVRDGIISKEGAEYYYSLRAAMLEGLPAPNAVLYLNVAPETCHQRLKMRGRDCESGIPLAYLEGLDECYRSWLPQMEAMGAQVVTVDWNDFGNTNQCVQALDAVESDSVEEWQAKWGHLNAFLADQQRIEARLSLPYSVRELDETEDLEVKTVEMLGDEATQAAAAAVAQAAEEAAFRAEQERSRSYVAAKKRPAVDDVARKLPLGSQPNGSEMVL